MLGRGEGLLECGGGGGKAQFTQQASGGVSGRSFLCGVAAPPTHVYSLLGDQV